MKWKYLLMSVVALPFCAGYAVADTQAPWGSATEIHQTYSGQKVVFDTTSGTLAGLTSVLDRASYISQIGGADPMDGTIVIVLHGESIPFFAIKNYKKHRALMQRAYSLSVGNIVEFRLCKAAAHLQGFKPRDIHGFIKMVPMADAEIVRLQQEEGFSYMR